jgi:hypothetical protein
MEYYDQQARIVQCNDYVMGHTLQNPFRQMPKGNTLIEYSLGGYLRIGPPEAPQGSSIRYSSSALFSVPRPLFPLQPRQTPNPASGMTWLCRELPSPIAHWK